MIVNEKSYKRITGRESVNPIDHTFYYDFTYDIKYVLDSIPAIKDAIFENNSSSLYTGSLTNKTKCFLKSICKEKNISIYDIDNTVETRFVYNTKPINIYILNSDFYDRNSLSEYGYVFDYNSHRINIFILDEVIDDENYGFYDFFALAYQLTEKAIVNKYSIDLYDSSSNNQEVMLVIADELLPYYKYYNTLFTTWYYFNLIYNMISWFSVDICKEIFNEDVELPVSIPLIIINKILKYLGDKYLSFNDNIGSIIDEADNKEFNEILKLVEDELYA